jgi:hypothetical protein
VQGDTIPLGSFLTAEAAARAYDGCAAATPGRALFSADYSARAPGQRAALTTRPGAHAHGLPQQQRDADDDDEPELLIASDCQLTGFDSSDEDDVDGDGVTSIERAARDSTQRNAPTAGIARGSKADCAQYVGVSKSACNQAAPFHAQIQLKWKNYHICFCPTAEAAARAYDAVACMIPGRKLKVPTTIPAAASSSRQREGASAVPAESDILAAIAAVRQAQPQLSRTGAVKYFGVCIDKTHARNPYRAAIQVDGKTTHLGSHPTAEAAARAYDAVAHTILGRKLNFPNGGNGAAPAAGGSRKGARAPPARGAGQPSQRQRIAR